MPTASGARLPPVVVGLVGNGEVSSLPQPGMSPPMSSPTTPPTSSFRTSISPVAHHHFYRRDEIDLHDPVEGLADEAGHDHANDEERIQLLGHHDSPAFRATSPASPEYTRNCLPGAGYRRAAWRRSGP